MTVTHDLSWQSGDVWSHVVVASGATFELAGTVEKILDAGPIDNAGAATYSGTNLTFRGTFNNAGSFGEPAENTIIGGGTFDNLCRRDVYQVRQHRLGDLLRGRFQQCRNGEC